MLRSPHLPTVKNKTFFIFFLWVVIACVFPACSVTDFIGAYFNTYYNAKRQFTEAEDELLLQRENKLNDRPFGYVFSVQSGTKTKFGAVIEKCSKLLQYHPESNLVDDALLMIGKSYYYQNEYQQADRKFKELLEQFPESDLASESMLLLGYNYYMMNDKAKSSGVATTLLDNATKGGNDDYVAKAAILLAQLEIDNKNIDQAKTYYQTAAEKGGTADERCAAYLNLAGLFSQEGNNQRALEAYRKARSASTNYENEYKARIGEARMLSKLGAHEESLTLLRDLLASSNYREFYGEISLEIGNVFKLSKDYPSAIAQYTYVDTSYARTEWSANSYFQLGDVYETKLFLLDSAQVYYARGKTEAPQALITPQLARRAEYLAKYIQIRNDIYRFDSIRTFILTPRDTTKMSVSSAIDSTIDSMHNRADTSLAHLTQQPPAIPDSAVRFANGRNRDSTGRRVPSPLLPVGDSASVRLANGRRPDSAIVRVPALPSITLDSANARLAYSKTELAALFYTTMSLPDSAEKWYRALLRDHPGSPQAPRALFTLAQIYSQDTTRSRIASDSLYREIVGRFPDSEFAPEAGRILGMPIKTKIADPAEASYARAEGLLSAGNAGAAGDTMRIIVRKYPTSPIASKAQYALGWIYERVDFQPDSAIANYRTLVSLYPGSRYAAIAKPKVDEYDISKKAPVPSLQDSTSAPGDSLKIRGKSDKTDKPLDLHKQDVPTIPSEQGKKE